MKAIFKGRPNFRRDKVSALAKARKSVADKLEMAVEVMTVAILERTPVYTGRTIVNFQWTLDAPAKNVRAPIKQPRLPGETSTQDVGEEARRPANAAVVRTEANKIKRSLRKNPYQKVYLVNNAPSFYMVEYGSYGKGGARTPAGGITRAGEAMIQEILRK